MQNSLNPAGYPTKRFQEKAFSELVSQSLPVCQAMGDRNGIVHFQPLTARLNRLRKKSIVCENMYQGTTSALAEKTLYGPEDVSGHDR
ncbi:MAG TPA: hypothetical protein VK129_10045 [Terriglobales bacterium]|nr:hypothetical protein [Terriglobales bacterium]